MWSVMLAVALWPVDHAVPARPPHVLFAKAAVAGNDLRDALLQALEAAILGDKAGTDGLHRAPGTLGVSLAGTKVDQQNRCRGDDQEHDAHRGSFRAFVPGIRVLHH
jgi:hypothetical protein